MALQLRVRYSKPHGVYQWYFPVDPAVGDVLELGEQIVVESRPRGENGEVEVEIPVEPSRHGNRVYVEWWDAVEMPDGEPEGVVRLAKGKVLLSSLPGTHTFRAKNKNNDDPRGDSESLVVSLKHYGEGPEWKHQVTELRVRCVHCPKLVSHVHDADADLRATDERAERDVEEYIKASDEFLKQLGPCNVGDLGAWTSNSVACEVGNLPTWAFMIAGCRPPASPALGTPALMSGLFGAALHILGLGVDPEGAYDFRTRCEILGRMATLVPNAWTYRPDQYRGDEEQWVNLSTGPRSLWDKLTGDCEDLNMVPPKVLSCFARCDPSDLDSRLVPTQCLLTGGDFTKCSSRLAASESRLRGMTYLPMIAIVTLAVDAPPESVSNVSGRGDVESPARKRQRTSDDAPLVREMSTAERDAADTSFLQTDEVLENPELHNEDTSLLQTEEVIQSPATEIQTIDSPDSNTEDPDTESLENALGIHSDGAVRHSLLHVMMQVPFLPPVSIEELSKKSRPELLAWARTQRSEAVVVVRYLISEYTAITKREPDLEVAEEMLAQMAPVLNEMLDDVLLVIRNEYKRRGAYTSKKIYCATSSHVRYYINVWCVSEAHELWPRMVLDLYESHVRYCASYSIPMPHTEPDAMSLSGPLTNDEIHELSERMARLRHSDPLVPNAPKQSVEGKSTHHIFRELAHHLPRNTRHTRLALRRGWGPEVDGCIHELRRRHARTEGDAQCIREHLTRTEFASDLGDRAPLVLQAIENEDGGWGTTYVPADTDSAEREPYGKDRKPAHVKHRKRTYHLYAFAMLRPYLRDLIDGKRAGAKNYPAGVPLVIGLEGTQMTCCVMDSLAARAGPSLEEFTRGAWDAPEYVQSEAPPDAIWKSSEYGHVLAAFSPDLADDPALNAPYMDVAFTQNGGFGVPFEDFVKGHANFEVKPGPPPGDKVLMAVRHKLAQQPLVRAIPAPPTKAICALQRLEPLPPGARTYYVRSADVTDELLRNAKQFARRTRSRLTVQAFAVSGKQRMTEFCFTPGGRTHARTHGKAHARTSERPFRRYGAIGDHRRGAHPQLRVHPHAYAEAPVTDEEDTLSDIYGPASPGGGNESDASTVFEEFGPPDFDQEVVVDMEEDTQVTAETIDDLYHTDIYDLQMTFAFLHPEQGFVGGTAYLRELNHAHNGSHIFSFLEPEGTLTVTFEPNGAANAVLQRNNILYPVIATTIWIFAFHPPPGPGSDTETVVESEPEPEPELELETGTNLPFLETDEVFHENVVAHLLSRDIRGEPIYFTVRTVEDQTVRVSRTIHELLVLGGGRHTIVFEHGMGWLNIEVGDDGRPASGVYHNEIGAQFPLVPSQNINIFAHHRFQPPSQQIFRMDTSGRHAGWHHHTDARCASAVSATQRIHTTLGIATKVQNNKLDAGMDTDTDAALVRALFAHQLRYMASLELAHAVSDFCGCMGLEESPEYRSLKDTTASLRATTEALGVIIDKIQKGRKVVPGDTDFALDDICIARTRAACADAVLYSTDAHNALLEEGGDVMRAHVAEWIAEDGKAPWEFPAEVTQQRTQCNEEDLGPHRWGLSTKETESRVPTLGGFRHAHVSVLSRDHALCGKCVRFSKPGTDGKSCEVSDAEYQVLSHRVYSGPERSDWFASLSIMPTDGSHRPTNVCVPLAPTDAQSAVHVHTRAPTKCRAKTAGRGGWYTDPRTGQTRPDLGIDGHTRLDTESVPDLRWWNRHWHTSAKTKATGPKRGKMEMDPAAPQKPVKMLRLERNSDEEDLSESDNAVVDQAVSSSPEVPRAFLEMFPAAAEQLERDTALAGTVQSMLALSNGIETTPFSIRFAYYMASTGTPHIQFVVGAIEDARLRRRFLMPMHLHGDEAKWMVLAIEYEMLDFQALLLDACTNPNNFLGADAWLKDMSGSWLATAKTFPRVDPRVTRLLIHLDTDNSVPIIMWCLDPGSFPDASQSTSSSAAPYLSHEEYVTALAPLSTDILGRMTEYFMPRRIWNANAFGTHVRQLVREEDVVPLFGQLFANRGPELTDGFVRGYLGPGDEALSITKDVPPEDTVYVVIALAQEEETAATAIAVFDQTEFSIAQHADLIGQLAMVMDPPDAGHLRDAQEAITPVLEHVCSRALEQHPDVGEDSWWDEVTTLFQRTLDAELNVDPRLCTPPSFMLLCRRVYQDTYTDNDWNYTDFHRRALITSMRLASACFVRGYGHLVDEDMREYIREKNEWFMPEGDLLAEQVRYERAATRAIELEQIPDMVMPHVHDPNVADLVKSYTDGKRRTGPKRGKAEMEHGDDPSMPIVLDNSDDDDEASVGEALSSSPPRKLQRPEITRLRFAEEFPRNPTKEVLIDRIKITLKKYSTPASDDETLGAARAHIDALYDSFDKTRSGMGFVELVECFAFIYRRFPDIPPSLIAVTEAMAEHAMLHTIRRRDALYLAVQRKALAVMETSLRAQGASPDLCDRLRSRQMRIPVQSNARLDACEPIDDSPFRILRTNSPFRPDTFLREKQAAHRARVANVRAVPSQDAVRTQMAATPGVVNEFLPDTAASDIVSSYLYGRAARKPATGPKRGKMEMDSSSSSSSEPPEKRARNLGESERILEKLFQFRDPDETIPLPRELCERLEVLDDPVNFGNLIEINTEERVSSVRILVWKAVFDGYSRTAHLLKRWSGGIHRWDGAVATSKVTKPFFSYACVGKDAPPERMLSVLADQTIFTEISALSEGFHHFFVGAAESNWSAVAYVMNLPGADAHAESMPAWAQHFRSIVAESDPSDFEEAFLHSIATRRATDVFHKIKGHLSADWAKEGKLVDLVNTGAYKDHADTILAMWEHASESDRINVVSMRINGFTTLVDEETDVFLAGRANVESDSLNKVADLLAAFVNSGHFGAVRILVGRVDFDNLPNKEGDLATAIKTAAEEGDLDATKFIHERMPSVIGSVDTKILEQRIFRNVDIEALEYARTHELLPETQNSAKGLLTFWVRPNEDDKTLRFLRRVAGPLMENMSEEDLMFTIMYFCRARLPKFVRYLFTEEAPSVISDTVYHKINMFEMMYWVNDAETMRHIQARFPSLVEKVLSNDGMVTDLFSRHVNHNVDVFAFLLDARPQSPHALMPYFIGTYPVATFVELVENRGVVLTESDFGVWVFRTVKNCVELCRIGNKNGFQKEFVGLKKIVKILADKGCYRDWRAAATRGFRAEYFSGLLGNRSVPDFRLLVFLAFRLRCNIYPPMSTLNAVIRKNNYDALAIIALKNPGLIDNNNPELGRFAKMHAVRLFLRYRIGHIKFKYYTRKIAHALYAPGSNTVERRKRELKRDLSDMWIARRGHEKLATSTDEEEWVEYADALLEHEEAPRPSSLDEEDEEDSTEKGNDNLPPIVPYDPETGRKKVVRAWRELTSKYADLSEEQTQEYLALLTEWKPDWEIPEYLKEDSRSNALIRLAALHNKPELLEYYRAVKPRAADEVTAQVLHATKLAFEKEHDAFLHELSVFVDNDPDIQSHATNLSEHLDSAVAKLRQNKVGTIDADADADEGADASSSQQQ